MSDARTSDLDLDAPVWGAENFGSVIKCNTRQVNHLLRTGRLDANKVGTRWVSTARRLRRSILGEVA